VQHKDSEQAHICLAYPTVPVTHPDRFVVDLISTVLGEGMSSRLFLELREERALVYDVHSYPSEFRDAGSITVYAGCDPQNARTTLEVSLAEIGKLISDLTEQELQKARQMARGRIQLRMEDTRSVAGWMGSQEMLLGQILTVDEAAERIDAVTMDDMLRVAGQLLQPGSATIAAVGPFDDDHLFSGLI
ncbi:MAG: insulinase family protein, partial [Chloroflexi bacterium CFX7]|nr:insulinase family protein [Chloroflexi bacterium CFX7]